MIYAFADCELDTDLFLLRRGDRAIQLSPRVFQTLRYLLEHRHRVVSKDELIAQVWAAQVVSDAALEKGITLVRQAIGDSGREQRLVQTLPGHGYRFVAAVTARGDVRPEDGQTAQAVGDAGPAARDVAPRGDAARVEHKTITVLCGLWTAPASGRDLDALHGVLEDVEALVRRVVEPYAGTLWRVAADRVAVLFGAPVAQEDHATRAVRAAMAWQQQWSTLPGAATLPLRLGACTGPVVVRLDGESPRAMQVLGEPAELAVEIAQAAAAGTIVLSATTARLADAVARTEPLPPVVVTGQASPLAVHRVLELRRDMVSGRGGEHGRFVGRQSELATLQARVGHLRDGRGQTVGIVGEAGIGKSRLLAEFRDAVTGRSLTYLRARCHAHGQTTPYLPIRELVQQWAQLSEGTTPAAEVSAVTASLRAVDLPFEDWGPYLLRLLEGANASDPPADLTPQAIRARTFGALHEIFLRTARQRPLVIEVEDVHWIDATSEAYLSALVERLGQVPVLLLVTYRAGYRPPWGATATQLVLGPLNRQESEQIVHDILRRRRYTGAVSPQLVARAAGNPLFLQAQALALAEHEASTPETTLPVPETVQAVLAARIDQLPSPAKRLLQTAAVIGPEVPQPLLCGVASISEAECEAVLGDLRKAGFLSETQGGPGTVYTFNHVLTQEVAYQSLLKRSRQQLHAQIARALLAQRPDGGLRQPELLAHHFTEAGLYAEAIDAWQRAGQHAIDRSSLIEAADHFRSAIALLPLLPDSEARLRQDLALHMALGSALTATKGYAAPEVEGVYRHARALCEQLPDNPQTFAVLHGVCVFYMGRADLHTADDLAAHSLRLAERSGDALALEQAHGMRGITRFWLGEFADARAALEQGHAHYDAHRRPTRPFVTGTDPAVTNRCYAAFVLWCLGHPDAARGMIDAARRLVECQPSPYADAYVTAAAVWIAQFRGEWQTAHGHVEALRALSAAQGFPFWLATSMLQEGKILVVQGETREGLKQIQQGLEVRASSGSLIAETWFLAMLAEAHAAVGQIDEGLQALASAQASSSATGERLWLAELHRLEGELLLKLARPDASEADACFQRALAVARDRGAKSLELRAAIDLCRLWQRQKKRAAARRLLAPIVGWFTEGFDTADLQAARALLQSL